jgi:hypothetical protein
MEGAKKGPVVVRDLHIYIGDFFWSREFNGTPDARGRGDDLVVVAELIMGGSTVVFSLK